MNKADYLIQGFFFQNQQFLGVEHFSEAEGGARAVIQKAVMRSMFSGIIFPKPDSMTGFSGLMQDHFGNSNLMHVIMDIDLKIVKFVKQYEHRPDVINYELTYDGKLWVGKYEGDAVGTGPVKCCITEVPESLFLPPPLES